MARKTCTSLLTIKAVKTQLFKIYFTIYIIDQVMTCNKAVLYFDITLV